MEKLKKVNQKFLFYFWILVIGSVFGFVVEMLYGLVCTRTLVVHKGLIYGPFIQIYGLGALLFYFVIRNEQDPLRAFFKGMIAGGALEYLFSFFEEIFFHSVSWEYSNLFLNINGRTSIQYCFYWGIIAVLFLKIIYPLFKVLETKIQGRRCYIISYALLVFVLFDVAISCLAVNRQEARKNNIPPANDFEVFLDQAYPDEFLSKIFNNKKKIPIPEE